MASASGLSRFLILSTIKQLADAGSWHRGREYADDGNVHSLVVRGDTLTATVAGTHLYTVRLSAGKNGLAHRCSCPQGVDGDFCKHLVAVALSWLEAAKASPAKNGAAPRRDGPPLVTLDHLRPWLLRQPTEKLADLLLDAAVQHDRLREKLLREIARGRGRGSNIAGYRESITRATRTGGFLDYEEAGEFAEAVSEAITPLHELLQEGHPAAVIELAEHALARVESALHEADDSAGEIGALLDELQDLHLAACKAARPDPKELARRLCNWELGGDWEVFHHAAETYADVLGPSGLAEYRRQVEAAWNELPALGPGDRKEYSSQRFRLTNIMEALARTTGDLDAFVAIKAKNLSHAYAFLQIARRVFAEAGAQPCRFRTADYLAAPKGAKFGGTVGLTPWDPPLQDTMQATRRSVHEEAVFEQLARELERQEAD